MRKELGPVSPGLFHGRAAVTIPVVAMKIDVSTILNCSAAKAWNEVQKSSLLRHVIWPLARFVPTGTFPERWSEGLVLKCKLFVFGVIPIGIHTLHFEKIDHNNYEIQSHEHDPLIARWDHLVSVKPLDDRRSIFATRLISMPAASPSWFGRGQIGSTVIANVGGVCLQRHCDRPRISVAVPRFARTNCRLWGSCGGSMAPGAVSPPHPIAPVLAHGRRAGGSTLRTAVAIAVARG